MPEPTTKEQFEFVFNAMRGAQTVQVISLGLQLGLLAALRDAPDGLSSDELAQLLSLVRYHVRVWCETGYALGVLDYADGRFRLPLKLDTVLLDTDHPRYLGAFVQGFTSYFQEDFARYPQAFKDGGVYPFGEHGEAFSAWVSTLTHPMQRLVVGRTLPELFGAQLERGLRVLDVGCGAGQLLFKLADAYPNGQYTGVDVDAHGIALARTEAQRRGITERIRFIDAPVEQVEPSGSFDLALMFEVFHELPVEVRPSVLAGTFRALRPGGTLFILDETWPDDPAQLRDPTYAMSVLVQFSELVWGNVVATESEQTRLLGEAGFTNLRRGDLGGVFTTIVASKPG
jgi:ubiquinone/menaquinone biosynthesis C-methylase UbiE